MDARIPNAARLQHAKKYHEAEKIYRQILRNQPKEPDALLLLGLLLHETGRNEEAAATLKKAAAIPPARIDVLQTLVGALVAMNRLPEAIEAAKQVVRLRPQAAESHYAVGQLLWKNNEFAAALPYARRAVELNPRSAAFLLTLSRIFAQLEGSSDALAVLEQGLKIEPRNADLLVDKAQLLQKAGQLDQAIVLYESALKSAPDNVSALNNLGSCYLYKVRPQEAIRCFEAAARLWPHSPKPRNNVGAALKDLGQIDDAIVQFQKSIEIDPTYADGYCNLGGAYATIAEHQRAIENFREALKLSPEFAGVGSNLLMSLLSWPVVSPQQVFEEHRDWDRRHAAPLSGRLSGQFSGNIPLPTPDPSPDRQLKIAYVSPDFREHSVRYFIEPILAHHDRAAVEVHCYAAGKRSDDVTAHLAKLVDHWHPIAGLSDRQLAETIRAHGIDILIDLAGHTADNRLPALTYKPAPVQVTYLGYPTTTGMNAIDYRLTDAICDPPGSDAFYSEKLVRLPNAFFVYADDSTKPFDPMLPADRNGHFTFGSFNSFTKFNDDLLESWARILQQTPGSHLFIKARPIENPSTRRKLIDFFATRGINAERLDLRPWVTLPEHIELLGSGIDLMLDTFPYNGHTTSCQAIWMGVPMVTRAGDSFRSRVGACILQNVQLPDFIAHTQDQYESIAAALAADLTRLRALRPTMRDRLVKSPLCAAASFTRGLESAYRAMWKRHCAAI